MKTKNLAVISIMFMVFLLSLMMTVASFGETLEKGTPIVIGAPIPRSSIHGQEAEKAMILAVEEINAAGGVKLGGSMHPFKLEIVDTRDHEPAVPTSDVLLAIEKLILSKKPHICMGGPNMSESAVAAMDLFAKYGVIHIHSIGGWTPAWHMKAAKDINKYRYVFKIATTVGYLMKDTNAIINHFKETFKFNKLFISIADAAHCRAAADIVEKSAVPAGWEIVGQEIHPLGTTDYSMMLRSVRKSGAQVLFVWDHTSESLQLQTQWYDLKIPAIPIGIVDGIDAFAMWERTKGKVGYTIYVGAEAGTLPDQKISPQTTHFFEAYKKRWGIEPKAPAVSPNYFGAYMLKDVFERAQSLDPNKLIPIIENIDMMTIAGRLRFDKTNHQAVYGDDPKEALLSQYFQWHPNGKRVTIWPKSIATGDILFPPWMK